MILSDPRPLANRYTTCEEVNAFLIKCDCKQVGVDKNGCEIKTNWHRLVENLENNPDFFISTKTNMLYYVQI